MKVILSSRTQAYIAQERKYLRAESPMGAKRFTKIIRRAKDVLRTFPNGGATDSAIPLTGAQRARIEGYLFDYDLIEGEVWIQGIISSTAVNTIEVEDDMDYEADDAPRRDRENDRHLW